MFEGFNNIKRFGLYGTTINSAYHGNSASRGSSSSSWTGSPNSSLNPNPTISNDVLDKIKEATNYQAATPLDDYALSINTSTGNYTNSNFNSDYQTLQPYEGVKPDSQYKEAQRQVVSIAWDEDSGATKNNNANTTAPQDDDLDIMEYMPYFGYAFTFMLGIGILKKLLGSNKKKRR